MSRPWPGQRGHGEAQRVGAEARRCRRGIPCAWPSRSSARLRLHQAGGALGDQVVERDAVDDVDRVEHVALRLRHLLAVLVADQAGDVDVA